MAVRMALPLGGARCISLVRREPLAAHGVVGLIVVQYLVGLVLETLMSLRVVNGKPAGQATPGSTSLPGPQSGRLAANSET